jgi:1-acyl-sn-glycerol-3-phosphate acyltransferase
MSSSIGQHKSQKRTICLARAHFWTKALIPLTRGIRVTNIGSDQPLSSRHIVLPAGPLILVANHSSHMDSAVLAGIIGRKRNTLFVAAGDYWTGSAFKSWAGRYLAGLFLVRREGNGWNDLLGSIPLIKEGTVLVIYPEGSRTRTGEIARFHTGAFRLAVASGAQVLPVALIGCRQALPVHGRFTRQRIVVRLGEPIAVFEETITEASALARESIIELLGKELR